CRQYDNEPLTF
nr:immunoglobulin light chain junction region [Macaca mulatta]